MRKQIHTAIVCLSLGVTAHGQAPVAVFAPATYTEVHDLTSAAPTLDQPFMLDAASTATVTFVAASSTLKPTLVDPSGATHSLGAADSVVSRSTSFDFSGAGAGPWNYAFTLPNPTAGTWRYRVNDAATITSARAVVFMLVTASPVSVTLLGGGQDYPVNQNIGLSLLAVDGKAAIKGSSITSISGVVTDGAGNAKPVSFLDDGKGLDSAANDGIYTATFQVSLAGDYKLNATVAGTSANGPFARSSTAGFRGVVPCGSIAAAAQGATFDLNGNGLPDGVDVTFTVTPKASGKFRLYATLSGSNGKSVSEMSVFTLATLTAAQKSVRFSTDDLKSLGVNGPYQISAGRLECIAADGTAQVSSTRASLGTTSAVDLTHLERAAIILTGNNSDTGVDTNSNGLFDRLDVKIGVDVITAGTYQWSAMLVAANSVPLASVKGTGTLPAGPSTITLGFDGASIGRGGIDGPFAIRNLSISGSGQSVNFGAAGNTSTYKFDQFEGAPARLAPGAVINGASFLQGGVAPGELVSIFGSNLGPATGVLLQFAPGSNDTLATTLSGVTVTFNGIPAPLFFVRADQINCQVPFELNGAVSATVAVYYQGKVAAGDTVSVVPVAPSIFTIGGGTGLAAMLNQNYSIHSLTNPAARGEAIQVFMTGQGAVLPPLTNGKLAPLEPPFPASPLPVTVTIGGLPAQVIFSGMAPGLVGLFQVDAIVPMDTVPGPAVPLIIKIGSTPSQPGVTIAVSGS